MSDIDPVSLSIGKLTGQVESLNSNVEHLIHWLKDHAEKDAENFEELNKKVAKLDAFKTRVYAVASVCSVFFTASFNYLTRKFN